MNIQRGDIVLLDYPYSSGGGTKVRPALVVQNDRDNRRLVNTIIVQITSVTRRPCVQWTDRSFWTLQEIHATGFYGRELPATFSHFLRTFPARSAIRAGAGRR